MHLINISNINCEISRRKRDTQKVRAYIKLIDKADESISWVLDGLLFCYCEDQFSGLNSGSCLAKQWCEVSAITCLRRLFNCIKVCKHCINGQIPSNCSHTAARDQSKNGSQEEMMSLFTVNTNEPQYNLFGFCPPDTHTEPDAWGHFIPEGGCC